MLLFYWILKVSWVSPSIFHLMFHISLKSSSPEQMQSCWQSIMNLDKIKFTISVETDSVQTDIGDPNMRTKLWNVLEILKTTFHPFSTGNTLLCVITHTPQSSMTRASVWSNSNLIMSLLCWRFEHCKHITVHVVQRNIV